MQDDVISRHIQTPEGRRKLAQAMMRPLPKPKPCEICGKLTIEGIESGCLYCITRDVIES
jgi:hypothetical protein